MISSSWLILYVQIWMFPKIVVPPNHPLKYRVFHYFHHSFWGFSHYFWKHLVLGGFAATRREEGCANEPGDWDGDGTRHTTNWRGAPKMGEAWIHLYIYTYTVYIMRYVCSMFVFYAYIYHVLYIFHLYIRMVSVYSTVASFFCSIYRYCRWL